MGRPRSFVYKNLSLYNKLHSTIVKMYCGIEITALYLVKETKYFYVSTEVWAHCASKLKIKKPHELSVNIPIITDEKTINFLEENCWNDYTTDNSDYQEAISFLNKVFPNKTKKYFFELDSLISAYCHGSFISYDSNGNVETLSDADIKSQIYYNHKYNMHIKSDEIKNKQDKWVNEKDEKLRDKYLSEYVDFQRNYAFEHNNIIDLFIEIGKKSVCYPVGFSEGTANWYKEKYGTTCAYSHVGEIFFVATENDVYFSITRHF